MNFYDGGKKFDTYDSYESTIKSGEQSLQSLKNDISLNIYNIFITIYL